MNKSNQAGFSVLGVVLVLAVLGLFGFIGWRVYEANKPVDSSPESSNQAIEKAEDLDDTVDELNNQDIDAALDTSEIDSALEE